jgi:hypothetical protein
MCKLSVTRWDFPTRYRRHLDAVRTEWGSWLIHGTLYSLFIVCCKESQKLKLSLVS